MLTRTFLAVCLLSISLTTAVAAQESTATAPAAAAPDKAIQALQAFIAEKAIDRTKPDWKTKLPLPPKAEFDPAKRYYWTLETNKGVMKIEFRPDVAPMHVSSTIYLTLLGFYDGLAFHRVITQFMAQGGCPIGEGTGDPGYHYGSEFDPGLRHTGPGLLSMANAGEGTDGSQFFITFVPTPWLDDKHTIFGEVIEGMDTLKKLEKGGSPGKGKPTEPLKIERATVTATPYVPDPAVQALDEFIANAVKYQQINRKSPMWKTKLPKPTQQEFSKDSDYFWILDTNRGRVKVRLLPEYAPMHVSSTIYLTRVGFYDSLTFHRVIRNFMAQGGCPLARGTGGPGYEYSGEFSPEVKHDRPGILSMANRGPGTDGSQFFLTFKPTPWLDGKHTIFGEVVDGTMDTVKRLEADGSSSGRPLKPLLLHRAQIRVLPKAKASATKGQ